jgi:hypothetical protein
MPGMAAARARRRTYRRRASRYQTGATAKNRLGVDGVVAETGRALQAMGLGYGTKRRELVIAQDETERKTGTACRVPTGKGEERFPGRGALGMMDEFG